MNPLPVILKVATPEFDALKQLVFRRYPAHEWATFARFGWRETANGLVIALASLDTPNEGDLNENVGHVAIDEQFTLRIALTAEKHKLAVGIIHSHPENCLPAPSTIDDDMDGYYARYFGDFGPNRPYISLILSVVDGRLLISGRVYWRGRWQCVVHTSASEAIHTWMPQPQHKSLYEVDRAARLVSAFGKDALYRLRNSSVAVIGAGGTGSAAIEVLARAGVGRLILVDPDVVDRSNLERIHGSYPAHASDHTPKVKVAWDHVKQIDPTIEVVPIIGRIPQDRVVDAVVTADVVLGCTDQQHSRLALCDLALRYLVPSIDTGVLLEGSDGRVSGQIAQLVKFEPADPCALCRGMINPRRLSQELMSEGERRQRLEAAEDAVRRGEDPNPYWHKEQQINTVGYLTTAVGAIVAGYAIGWITNRFAPPFNRLQMNFVARYFDVTDQNESARTECVCTRMRGWADQGSIDALITAPPHWPEPVIAD